MNKNTPARIAANNRYNAKKYDRLNIAVPKGKKDIVKSAAASAGLTVNGWVNQAIDEKLTKDNPGAVLLTDSK